MSICILDRHACSDRSKVASIQMDFDAPRHRVTRLPDRWELMPPRPEPLVSPYRVAISARIVGAVLDEDASMVCLTASKASESGLYSFARALNLPLLEESAKSDNFGTLRSPASIGVLDHVVEPLHWVSPPSVHRPITPNILREVGDHVDVGFSNQRWV